MSSVWRVLLAAVATILSLQPGTAADILEGSTVGDLDIAGLGMDPNG